MSAVLALQHALTAGARVTIRDGRLLVPSPSAAAIAAGVGAGGNGGQAPTFNITVTANGAVIGDAGPYGVAAQKGGSAFWSAFNEALATTSLPPVRTLLGGADNLLEP